MATCFLLAALAAAQPTTVLVADGQARCRIVLPADPSATLQFAGAELAKYLQQIAGAEIPVGRAAGEGVPIRLGQQPGEGAVPADLGQAHDATFAQLDEGRLTISGGSDRGTLYAVYRFLEQQLGCRWLARGIESVPTSLTIALADFTDRSAPAFDLRTFVGRRDDATEWGAKVGLNGFYKQRTAASVGPGYYLPDAVPSCHAYHALIPAKTYGQQHPEWFPLLNGQRVVGRDYACQLCVTAPGLADEFARNVNRLFDEDPSLRTVSISPNDGRGWCECETCQALDQKLCGGRTTKQGLAAERPFRGDRVFWFANQVAERVAKVHPDKLLLVLAYINYAEPPDTVKPLPNVVPWLCHYAPADYSRPIADPTSEANAEFNALLLRWAKADPDLLFYAYVSKSMWWRLPRPVTRSFAADVKHLHALGIHRYYCQSSLSDWQLDGPLYYVIAKLLWDPEADPETIRRDWLDHMFGPAADAMAAFYDTVEQAVKQTGQSYSDSPPGQVPGLYDAASLDLAQTKLAAALQLAEGEVRDRILQIVEVYAYGYHMVRCLEAGEGFKLEPTPARMKLAQREGAEALSHCRVREAKEYVATLVMQDMLGAICRGFGQTEQKGGRDCWNSDETGLGDGRSGWATIALELPAPTRAVRLELEVWGQSELESIVINTSGDGKGYSDGGIWTPVPADEPLSGKAQWDTLVFRIPPEAMAPGKSVQTVGFGGGDSQIWVASARVQPGH